MFARICITTNEDDDRCIGRKFGFAAQELSQLVSKYSEIPGRHQCSVEIRPVMDGSPPEYAESEVSKFFGIQADI